MGKKISKTVVSFFVPKNKNVILCINGLNYVRFKYGDKDVDLLVDTGASVSVFFQESLIDNLQLVNQEEKINISGIGGVVQSKGSAYIKLNSNGYAINQKFVVIEALDKNVDGILGSDFFQKFKASINYEYAKLSFYVQNNKVNLQMSSKRTNSFRIPPRCEMIKQFKNLFMVRNVVVCNEEIGEGVFVAGSIAQTSSEGEIPVQFLNTTDREIEIKNFVPKLLNADDYKILSFEKSDKMTVKRVENVLDKVKLDHLNKEEKSTLEKICAKYADVFQLDDDPLTTTNIYKHKIQLENNVTPAYCKPYRLPYAQKSQIDTEIAKMLKNKIIEPAKSAWSAPLLIVPKKSNDSEEKKWRVVIDFRLLNKKLMDDKFPLPNINEILDSLAGAMYFSHLDLSQGYYQIELERDCRPYTAFTTSKGQYQMTRLPMGLKVAPSVFSRAMTIAMSGLNYESCFIYLDDLIVFGNNLENHNRNLVKVMSRLRKVNLKLNPNKCEFLKKEILYLGHLISADGISPDPEKIKTVKQYPVPTDANATKRFVAFANYYRSFIQNFSQIANPLNKLTKKNAPFVWTEECQNAFDTLKQKLVSPPVLDYPDLSDNNIFTLKTDASGTALGAALFNKNDKPVAYASRALNTAEARYCTIEKELLGIVWAVKHFRPYLYGKRFIIQTDHRPLVSLFKMTNPSSRLTKFRLVLEEYDFTVVYIKGKSNVTADALSRIEISSDELKESKGHVDAVIRVMTRARNKQLLQGKDQQIVVNKEERLDHPGLVELLKKPKNAIELKIVDYKFFNQLKNRDGMEIFDKNIIVKANMQMIYLRWSDAILARELRSSLKALQKLCTQNNINELVLIKVNEEIIAYAKKLKEHSDLLGDINITILRGRKTIEDSELRQLILNDFHILPTGGHAGISRMYNRIKKYYFWKGLHKSVESFVKRCDDCQRYKHSIPDIQPLSITTTAAVAFEKISLDLMGPLAVDIQGNRYILTIQCDLSKYVEAYPIENKEAETVAKAFVNNFILRYGIPNTVLHDQGTEFMSSVFSEACKILGIKQLHSTSYHHQTLGGVENSHKNLGTYLRTQTAKYSQAWSSWVPFWCFCYNTTVHTETKYTPYELVFGRVAYLPSNLDHIDPVYSFDNYQLELKFRLQQASADARENLLDSKMKRKNIYDQSKKNCNSNVSFNVGDLVLVKNNSTNKMDELFKGPYEVLRDESPNVVIVIRNKEVVVHKNRVKKYNK